MRFYPDDAAVPAGLATNDFRLRMLRASDAALDYAAVMASQEILHQRSGGDWPRDGFTLAENLADLEEHERDFYNRSGFTYTIMNPDETVCLGCLYIYPLETILRKTDTNGTEFAQIGDYEAQASFWVRPSGHADDLDQRVLAALIPWLKQDFAFRRIVLQALASEKRYVATLRASGLREVFARPSSENTLLLFAL